MRWFREFWWHDTIEAMQAKMVKRTMLWRPRMKPWWGTDIHELARAFYE